MNSVSYANFFDSRSVVQSVKKSALEEIHAASWVGTRGCPCKTGVIVLSAWDWVWLCCRCFRRCEEAFPISMHSIKDDETVTSNFTNLFPKRRILLVLHWSHHHEKNREGLVYQDPPCINLKETSSLEAHSVHATSRSTGILFLYICDCTISRQK